MEGIHVKSVKSEYKNELAHTHVHVLYAQLHMHVNQPEPSGQQNYVIWLYTNQ